MTDHPTVLRLTPAFDWRVVPRAPDHPDSAGGLAVQSALQATGTARLGVVQEVLTMACPGLPRRATVVAGVQLRAVGSGRLDGVHRRNLAWLLGVLVELVRRRARRPDVVHVHASGLLEPLLAALAARFLLRRPVVLTVHCSAQATYRPQSRKDEIVQVITRAAERAAVRRAARTLTLTRRVASVLDGRSQAMPDWVQVERFAPDGGITRSRGFAGVHGVPSDTPVVLFIGRISREKGWPALLAICEATEDLATHLVVCGDGPDLTELQARVQALGMGRRFTLTGAVSPDEVAAALGCASVLVLPSAHEEMGSVLVEAMAAGVPSVAYAVGGTSEVIENGVTGMLVADGDERGLVSAVRRAIGDPELQACAAQRGPERARATHDAESGARRLVELYRELTSCEAP